MHRISSTLHSEEFKHVVGASWIASTRMEKKTKRYNSIEYVDFSVCEYRSESKNALYRRPDQTQPKTQGATSTRRSDETK